MRRRFGSLRALGGAGACLLMLGVACGDESKHGGTASGGSAGALSAAGGSAAVSSGGVAGAAAPMEAGASVGGTGGEAFSGGASGAATAQGGTDESGAQAGSSGQAEAGAAGASFQCAGERSDFASSVLAYEFGSGQAFGQDKFPAPVLGPPRGGGCCGGSMDVTSLGDGGWVALEFANNVIADGEGADFLVFENAFVPSGAGPESVFAELGKVSVSQDGITWVAFPCTRTSYPYTGCAGWHPVLANADTNALDPTDPAAAGGDAFDLAEVGLAWARYVRIEDLADADGGTGTFDLDAVSVVHSGCP